MNTRTLIATALVALAVLPATAREPGTPPAVPPGATLGAPVGAPFPVDGIWLSTNLGGGSGPVKEDSENNGLDATVYASVFNLHWQPGWTFLGGKYRATAVGGFLHVDQDVGAPFPPPLHGNASNSMFTDTVINPINLHWMLEPGIFASVGTGITIPTAEFTTQPPNEKVGFSVGAPVISFDAGLSYLRDGWNASLRGSYYYYFENRDTNYHS